MSLMNAGAAVPEAASQIALPSIVRLRYWLAAGQALTPLAVDRLLGIDLPLEWLAVAPVVTLASNLWLSGMDASADPGRSLMGIFVLDTLCLTGVLMLSGGPSNPFSLLYLVAITLAATLLTKRQTWMLGGLATVCFGALFWIHEPIPALEGHAADNGADLHLIGMWVGFAVAAFLIAMFSGRIAESLREREASLLEMQAELSKKNRLASLATLAAGAAHELSTPLATIAVAAGEMARNAKNADSETEFLPLAEDAELISSEVERCREIIARMRWQGAEPGGEPLEEVSVGELIDAALSEYGRIQREVPDAVENLTLGVPRHALEQAIGALIRNALDAESAPEAVTVSASIKGDTLSFQVKDRGTGMASETLDRVGEPFFTTKQPGDGMGLGIFLVRSLADQLGGSLTYESAAGWGTIATLELPAESKD